jgi:hypothetical protein
LKSTTGKIKLKERALIGVPVYKLERWLEKAGAALDDAGVAADAR